MNPQLDINDFFAFQGRNRSTVLIQTLSLVPGAQFHPHGQYAFHLDLDGDFRADRTYRVSFGDAGQPGPQPLRVHALNGRSGTVPDAPGEEIAAGETGIIITGADGIRIWAGQAADPFWINTETVTAVAAALQGKAPLDLPTVTRSRALNLFAGRNVNAIAIEIPGALLDTGGRRAGTWATTVLRDHGTWVRIQRCGAPLVPTIFFDPSGEDADAWNAADPAHDREAYGPLISGLAARAAAELGTAGDPQAHGQGVADALLPDLLWYRPGTPAQFGFADRNGRWLTDPVAEVQFSIVTGRAIPLGIDASSAAGTPRSVFPYLGAPLPAPVLSQA
jgi:hypothetical protein